MKAAFCGQTYYKGSLLGVLVYMEHTMFLRRFRAGRDGLCYHTVKRNECEEVNDITKLELVAAIGPNQLELVQVGCYQR